MALRQVLVAIRYSHERSGLAALEPVQRAPGSKQGVLDRVLGVVKRAQHPVAVGLQFAPERFHEPGERALVTRTGSREQLALAGVRSCHGPAMTRAA